MPRSTARARSCCLLLGGRGGGGAGTARRVRDDAREARLVSGGEGELAVLVHSPLVGVRELSPAPDGLGKGRAPDALNRVRAQPGEEQELRMQEHMCRVTQQGGLGVRAQALGVLHDHDPAAVPLDDLHDVAALRGDPDGRPLGHEPGQLVRKAPQVRLVATVAHVEHGHATRRGASGSEHRMTQLQEEHRDGGLDRRFVGLEPGPLFTVHGHFFLPTPL